MINNYESLVVDANIGSGKKKRKLHSGTPICSDEKIDSEVSEFLELQRSEGIAVSTKISWRRHFKSLKSKVSMAFLHPKCGSEGGKRDGMWDTGGVPIRLRRFQVNHPFPYWHFRYRELHKYRNSEFTNMDQTMCR